MCTRFLTELNDSMDYEAKNVSGCVTEFLSYS